MSPAKLEELGKYLNLSIEIPELPDFMKNDYVSVLGDLPRNKGKAEIELRSPSIKPSL